MHELLTPGTVIEVCYPIFKHYAVVSDRYVDGHPTLISLSRRSNTVTEEPWRQATQGRRINISPIHGRLPGHIVVANARACIGAEQLRWNLLTSNCEHFVRLVHGLPVQSDQVRNAVKGAVVGALGTLLLPKVTLTRLAIFAGSGMVTGMRRYTRTL
jgi:hypothetical protein